MMLVIASCVSEEEPVEVPVSDAQQAVEDAKAWFGPQEEFVVNVQSGKNARVRDQIKKIHWNKVITHDNGNVLEVMIDYNFHGVPVKGEKSAEQVREKEKLTFYRLILKKDEQGGYKKSLIKYFPAQKIPNQSKLNVNNYKALSESFTGEVLMYDWEENLLMGWEVAEGQKIRFFRSREVRKGNNGENLAQECQNYSEVICISYDIIDENGDSQQVLDCTLGPVVECPGDDDDSGPDWWVDDTPTVPGGSTGTGGSGSGTGSGSGGNLPTLEPLLEDLLYDMPFALLDSDIPCSLIMQWLEIAKFTPGQSIIDKLNTYTASYPDHGDYTVSDVANIQQIDNALSKAVNMDYFAVTVSTLPVVNGSTLGPQQFLNYIRTNINSFTDQSLSTFSPLQWGSINDTNLWNSGNPYGAVINIDIQGPENGSVVTSLSSPTRWIFTTIRDPKYGHHPVSGNREFGYSVNSNGSYTFYTKGVDRLTGGLETFAQAAAGIPFTSADNLWKSFQNKITEYVNQNGGSASKIDPVILRPDWPDVLDVIDGIKPPSTLSKDC